MCVEEVEIGDVVMLKSGGPVMTVAERSTHRGCFKCVWFEGDHYSETSLHQSTLDKVLMSPPKGDATIKV
jgi:uncharacterized protein YodC (DUF2158 family)